MSDKSDADLVKLGVKIVVVVVGIIFCCFFVFSSFTTVGADEIVVKQNAMDGQLQVWGDPGVHMLWNGHVTRYKKSAQYWFSAHKDEGKDTDDSIKVRFNDGGHGNVSGSLRYNLPLDPAKMLALHSTYGSMQAIDHELIRQVVNKSVFMTGPLMSSRESYAEKRADLINFIQDQIMKGVYKTDRKPIKTVDPVSGQEKTVDITEPKLGEGPNGILREEESPIDRFGVTAYNITINGVDYDPAVEEQIKNQQAAVNAVQQAMVDAKKAEQNAITVAKQYEAEIAKSKGEQDVIKAKAVTEAQQKVEVAKLELETAKLDKENDITTAQGQAEAKKLVMSADGQLALKLDYWLKAQQAMADALSKQRQTPDVVVGGGSNGVGADPMKQMLEMYAIQSARQLNVNPSPTK
jgi:hypothetical protein